MESKQVETNQVTSSIHLSSINRLKQLSDDTNGDEAAKNFDEN